MAESRPMNQSTLVASVVMCVCMSTLGTLVGVSRYAHQTELEARKACFDSNERITQINKGAERGIGESLNRCDWR